MTSKLKSFYIYLRREFFNTPINAVLTILISWMVVKVGLWFIDWAFVNAVWTGENRDVAQKGGATWAFIYAKLRFFAFGFYPKEHIVRIIAALVLMAGTFIPYFIKKVKHKVLVMLAQMLIIPVLIAVFLSGAFGLEKVSTNDWGGLTLTIILSVTGLLYSFPVGILMALGRRSRLPVVRGLCIAYIEFFRGIPLITILFMSSVVVPFFLPGGVAVDKITRVIIGMSVFQSAYLAEVIRGGLQSIDKGQYEAADSLGFKPGLQSYLIILPQALKITISNIGGISISFIKDTTLVLIIGMFDLLGIVSPLASDTNWLGMEPEGLIFAGIIYWIICFTISRLTYKFEDKVNTLPASAGITGVQE